MNRAIRLTEPIEEAAIWLPIKIMKCASPKLCWSRSALDRVSGKVVGNQSSSRHDPECHKHHWLVRVMHQSPPTRPIFLLRVRCVSEELLCKWKDCSWDFKSDLMTFWLSFIYSSIHFWLLFCTTEDSCLHQITPEFNGRTQGVFFFKGHSLDLFVFVLGNDCAKYDLTLTMRLEG